MATQTHNSRFMVGDRYIPTGKKYVCTIVDILKTYNLAGELVKTEYKSSYHFVNDGFRLDCDTTVARGLITD